MELSYYSNSGSDAIIITVPSGSVNAYTTTWGVSAATAAEGNTSEYGCSHNTITITDASS